VFEAQDIKNKQQLHSAEFLKKCYLRLRALSAFLCEFSTMCKNYLTRKSVTQLGLIGEGYRLSKISRDCPFNRNAAMEYMATWL
jgi:hypothetical protein